MQTVKNELHRDDFGLTFFEFSLNQECHSPIDLWAAVKGSQQGNGAHSFFIHITESTEFEPYESDSMKLGDKPIPILGTFLFVDWQHQS